MSQDMINAMNRLSAALEERNALDMRPTNRVQLAVEPVAHPEVIPVRMNAGCLIKWAADRGLMIWLPLSAKDVERCNHMAESIGHPPIELIYDGPERRRVKPVAGSSNPWKSQ